MNVRKIDSEDNVSSKLYVSIIIPVFNDHGGLQKCLQEISKIRYPHDFCEVIVVDNGSDYPVSLNGLCAFEGRLISCETPGSYAARNAGVRIAKGEVLWFLDADCWPGEGWLAFGLSALKRFGGHSVVGGDVKVIRPENPTPVALYQCLVGFGQEENIYSKNFSATANVICFRSQFEKIGFFSEMLLSGGDREWSWRAIRSGFSIEYEPRSIVYTKPRTTLRSAITQVRRVAAGRKMLRELGMTYLGDEKLTKKRTPWQAVTWIFCREELSRWEKIQVFSAASIIWLFEGFEKAKLAFGSNAERR